MNTQTMLNVVTVTAMVLLLSMTSTTTLAVTAQTVVPSYFPELPPQYHVIVSANFAVKGYTMAYEEWDDASLNLTRADGKLTSPDIIQFLYSNDTSNKTIVTVTSNSCTNSANEYGLFTLSIRQLLARFNSAGATWIQQTSIRGIPCNQYMLKFGNETDGYAFNATFYYSVVNPGVENVSLPIRIEVNGYLVNTTTGVRTSFANTYSFVAWSTSFSSDDVFSLYKKPRFQCTHTDDLPSIADLPNSSSVQPSPSSTMPQLPSSFHAWIETKVSTTAVAVSSKLLSVSSFHYYFTTTNSSTRRERVDIPSSPSLSILASYQPYTNTNSVGMQYTFTTTNNMDTCMNVNWISDVRASPVMNALNSGDGGGGADDIAGLIGMIFANPGLVNKTAVYVNRSPIRGISCDLWQATNVSITAPVPPFLSYTLTFSLYFYPQGWQFPGRRAMSGSSFVEPLAAVNVFGVNTATKVPVSDSWDFVFFQLINSAATLDINAVDAKLMNTTLTPPSACAALAQQLQTPTTPSPTPAPTPGPVSTPKSSSTGTAVAAVLGVIAGLVIMYGIWRYWQKQKSAKQQQFKRQQEDMVL